MKNKMKYIKGVLAAVIVSVGCFAGIGDSKAHAFSPQVVQKGATGEDVIELQARLQYVGFYHGPIDGVFGWRTYWALKNFQYQFGLPIDGLAGFKTKIKLAKVSKYNAAEVMRKIQSGKKFTTYSKGAKTAKATRQPPTAKGLARDGAGAAAKRNASPTPQFKPAKNIPDGYSQNDINLMANAVYGESRGEPFIGQVAVAAVIINRVQSASFPNTVSGVIFQPGAFTAVADGQIYLTPNAEAKRAVMDALNGWDPTGHAMYYFNPDTATSGWIWGRPQIKKIGKHIFTK